MNLVFSGEVINKLKLRGFRCWSGGAKVLGRLPVPGRLLIWILVVQGPIALAIGAGVGCLDIFSLNYHFSFISPSLWETARYRLKYCLKGPLNPEQPTNQMRGFRATSLSTYNERNVVFFTSEQGVVGWCDDAG